MNTSYAKETNYYFLHGSERLKDIPFYIQESNLPSITYSIVEVPNKVRNLALSGGNIEYDEITVKFIVDEFWQNYLAILDEIQGYKNEETGVISPHPVNSTMMITSNKGTPFLQFMFEDCIITNLGDQPFNDSTMDDEQLFTTFTIRFTGLTYTIIDQALINDNLQNDDTVIPTDIEITTIRT